MRVDGLIVLLAVIINVSALQWIALHNSNYKWNRELDCGRAAKAYNLHKSQRKFCKNNLHYMKVVVKAAQDILYTCQYVFRSYRWNCSSLAKAPNFTPDLTAGTREQAYVYALASAGLIQALAKACSSRVVAGCDCGIRPPTDDDELSGCSDNLAFGSNFARLFLEKPWKMKSSNDKTLAPINRHNYRLGRRVVSRMLKTECTCHGISGACTTKTCWEVLPPLEEIGEQLREKYYQHGIEVEKRLVGVEMKYKPVNSRIPKLNNDDLIYITKSPDYCVKDEKLGSVGTVGRTCNASATDSSGCDSMCCGRGYVISIRKEHYKCNCRIVGCCDVKCDDCERVVEDYVCL